MSAGGKKKKISRSINRRRIAKNAEPPAIERLSWKFPYLLVFACCLLFAVQLGIFQPYFYFEKTSSSAAYPGCNMAGAMLNGYASGSDALAYLPHAENFTAAFAFAGSGKISGAQFGFDEPGIAIDGIDLNGMLVCGPCVNFTGRVLGVDDTGGMGAASGMLLLQVRGHSISLNRSLQSLGSPAHAALFENVYQTHMTAPLHMSVAGGWAAATGRKMPSSFYGEDAPFHMNRVPILAGYLSHFALPWSAYSFVSMVPPALFYAATALPHEYAFKAWEILLFFVPIGIFYLFSRKGQQHSAAVFVLSSLAYLFLPSLGYPLGGGADLFFYGMAPHTIATYCSLLFFLFSYEFVLERGGGKKQSPGALPEIALLLLCAALSALAFASNPRIIFTLGIGFAVIAFSACACGRLRRAAILLMACAASGAWLAYSFLQDFSFGGYGALGGAAPASGMALLLLVQVGYAILPALFAVGAYFAWKKKSFFTFICAGYSAIMFVFATSDAIQHAAPFADVLRFLPSFYLLFAFVSGVGLAAALEWCALRAASAGRRFSLGKDVFAIALMLSVIAPAAFLMMAFGSATVAQYSQKASSLDAASDYSSFAAARALIGSERAAMVSRGDVSEYPAFDTGLERIISAPVSDPSSLSAWMKSEQLRYVIIGNEAGIGSANDTGEWQVADAIGVDADFERVLDAGTVQVFALKGASPAPDAYGNGTYIEEAETSFDRASVNGECRAENCTVLVYSQTIPRSAVCNGMPKPCSLSIEPETGAIAVSGISRGRFSFEITPQHSPAEIALIVAGIAALALSVNFCRE